MTTAHTARRVLLFAVIVLLSGCAHAVSYEMRQKVKKDLPFPAVLRDPEAHRGQTVIWGGWIIETINKEDSTIIKVLQTPIDVYGIPLDETRTQGRFLARLTGYVDGEVYKQGKMITVAGEITGKETEPLGETHYTYPVVQVKEVHLWKNPDEYRPYPRPFWHWDWYGYPYPYPWPY